MTLEVELKFPLPADASWRNELARLNCCWQPTVEQCDLYFSHPARDFSQTDEALRLRRTDNETCITYKGPKLDSTTKTRREIELPLPDDFDSFRTLLEVLGFRPVLEVRKKRISGTVVWQNREVILSVDEVAGLGNYLEMELLSEPEQLAAASSCLHSLATHLGLKNSERRGYIQLLLDQGAKLHPLESKP